MKNYKKTFQIYENNFVGTMSTPQRTFEGEAGRRQTQARDFWGPVSVQKSWKIDKKIPSEIILKKSAPKKMKHHAEK